MLFLLMLTALLMLSWADSKVSAQPLLPKKQRTAVRDAGEYAKKNSGLPNDSTQGKKKGKRRVHTVELWGNEEEAYSIYLDGQEYFKKISYDIPSEPYGYSVDSYVDGEEAILTAEEITIPESQYSGMYDVSTVLKPVANDSFNDEDNLYAMPTGSYTNFETLQEYLDYKEAQGEIADEGDETYWSMRYAWSQQVYEYFKAQPNYQACLNADNINTLSFEDAFGVLDNSRTSRWRDEPRCVPDFCISLRDAGFIDYVEDGPPLFYKNLGIKQLIVPSKVKMLRWLQENSAQYTLANNPITYMPNLETVTFASNENMRQIGGFKNYKKLKNCAIGDLTGLKVIEDECFSGCTALNIDSVDLRDKWVGREAFNGVRATHLDIGRFNTQKGGNAKLYGVQCPVIKIHHESNDNAVLQASYFLKNINGTYVLDSAKASTVYVPCRLYPSYRTATGWRDIKEQIVPYNEKEEDQCSYYVIIDGERYHKDVAYSKDDENRKLILRGVGNKTGRVLEIPHDFEDIGLDMGYTVQEIGPSVCRERSDFKRVILPTSITTIDAHAFRECGVEYVSVKGKSTESNSFPEGIVSIELEAFYRTKLKDGLSFPYGIKKLGKHSFAETYITSLYLPGSLKTEAGDLGHWTVNGREEAVYFQGSTFAIGESAFFGCPLLSSVYMAEGINGVGDCAFQFNSELVSMHIPNSMRYIGGHFCCAAWKMTSLTIPAGVTDIDGSFLHGCQSMRHVYLLGPPSMLKAVHYRSGSSFGPVDPILEYDLVPNYWCKHVNNCTFHVNDEATYIEFITYENLWDEKPWLRLDRYDLAYNLYGSNNPNWTSDYWFSHHVDDFPVNPEVYAAAANSLNGTGNAPALASAARRDPAALPDPVEGRTNDATAYLSTGYHNTYNYFPNSTTIQLKDGKWSTICFPKYIPEDLETLLGPGAVVAVLTSAKLDRQDPMTNIPNQKYMYHLTFTPISVSEMEVDQPYLIRPGKTETINIPVYDEQHPMEAADWTKTVIKTVQATEEVEGTTTDISMVGTYLDYKLRKAEFYLKNYREADTDPWSMKFYKNPAYGSSSVGPFKCYFKIEKNGIQINNAIMYNALLDMDTDGVGETPIADTNGEWPEAVYTLNGMRITNTKNLKPGIYIMNGKKVVVK